MTVALFRGESGYDKPSDDEISASFLDVRDEMSRRIAKPLQPFLTWLTAKPVTNEAYHPHTPVYHVVTAYLWLMIGVAASIPPLIGAPGPALLLLPFALLATTSGMGKLQAVVYHHCSHGTVFASRPANNMMGRFIGILLLVKQFDLYQKEHMLHHSPKKLLTHEDEFAQFIFNLLGLAPGLPKRELWRRVVLGFASPFFHLRFLLARISSCLATRSVVNNLAALAFWGGLIGAVSLTDVWLEFTIVWLVPVVVLFQIATALRTLCEHRFPDASVIAGRDKKFVGLATAGVFAGAPVPARSAATLGGFVDWFHWWAEMLTVHLFARLFVLVGDAPCHDYHHRHPSSRRWPNYIHERQADLLRGSPGYPVNYIETWGLFTAVDENLASLAATGKRVL